MTMELTGVLVSVLFPLLACLYISHPVLPEMVILSLSFPELSLCLGGRLAMRSCVSRLWIDLHVVARLCHVSQQSRIRDKHLRLTAMQ